MSETIEFGSNLDPILVTPKAVLEVDLLAAPLQTLEVVVPGPPGDAGAPGADGLNGTNGVGVPAGGAAGRVLRKVSAADYDTAWQELPPAASLVDDFKGPYDSARAYVRGNVVANKGGTFVAIEPSTNVSPDPLYPDALLATEVTAQGVNNGTTGQQAAQGFTVAAQRIVQVIHIFHSGTVNTTGRVGIASAVAGATVTWMGFYEGIVSGSSNWSTYTLPAPLTLEPGITYHLMTPANAGISATSDATLTGGTFQGFLRFGASYETTWTLYTRFKLAPRGALHPWRPVAFSGTEVSGASDIIVPVDINDSWVVGARQFDRMGSAANSIRAFFNKATGAFRAGSSGDTTEWDAAQVGQHSAALGLQNRASGARSFSAGALNIASGQGSTAIGESNTASGTQSSAEGNLSQASNSQAHAEGYNTRASGAQSHAEGHGAIASGSQAHAEGLTTTASGQGSHAEGGTTVASAGYSHAQGFDSVADQNFSHADGARSLAPLAASRAHASGMFGVRGDAQACEAVFKAETTTAAVTTLLSFYTTASYTGATKSVIVIGTNRAYTLRVKVVARRTDVVGEVAGFTWEGLVAREAAAPRIVGSPLLVAWGDAPATNTWAFDVIIDSTNNVIQFVVTGEAAKTIRWVASAEWVEVG